jgi:hypothetical protein
VNEQVDSPIAVVPEDVNVSHLIVPVALAEPEGTNEDRDAGGVND